MSDYGTHLKALSEAIGVSGQEEAVRDIVLHALPETVTDVRIDAMGNVLAFMAGTDAANRPRVMLDAHMDEIGFLVTGYDSDGLLHVDSIGGIDPRILPAQRLRVGPKALPAAFIWAPIHKNHDQNVMKLSNMRVDIGASSKSDAQGKAPLGTPVVFDSWFGEHGRLWRGKAMDDRAGVSVLLDVLARGPYKADVLIAFTTQEEVGLRGATVAARALNPDVAFSLETTTANDIPDPSADPDDTLTASNPTCELGRGTAITRLDRSVLVSPKMLAFIESTAQAAGLPYQFKTRQGGGNDAGAILQQNAGIPSATLSIPARYIHSPTALIDPNDYATTVQLVAALLDTIDNTSLAT